MMPQVGDRSLPTSPQIVHHLDSGSIISPAGFMRLKELRDSLFDQYSCARTRCSVVALDPSLTKIATPSHRPTNRVTVPIGILPYFRLLGGSIREVSKPVGLLTGWRSHHPHLSRQRERSQHFVRHAWASSVITLARAMDQCRACQVQSVLYRIDYTMQTLIVYASRTLSGLRRASRSC
jgi:hypothetical protein